MIAIQLAGLTCLYLLLTLIVIGAGALGALALGMTNRLLLLTSGLVTLGLFGMIVFWVYLIGAGIGRVVAIALMIGCVLVDVVGVVKLRRDGTGRLLLPLLPAVAFFCANSVFATAIGYLRGGTVTRLGLAGQSRYLVGLPDDNELPWYLIRQLQASSRPLPHFLAKPWQTSDRPPMQSGLYLLEHSLLGDGRFLDYQLLSMIFQSLWIFGVWAFLVSAKLPSRAVALGLAVTAFSGFAIINTFFVWPKLLPAAYLMLVAAALLSPALGRLRASRGAGLLVGLAAGCAMLGHPGSIFVVISMALALLIIRSWLSLRLLAGGVLGLIITYVPWMLFQRYYAPPGDFLDKFQLANTRNYLDKRSLSQAIADAYRQAGWSGTLSNKWHNLTRPFTHTFQYPVELFRVNTSEHWSLTGGGTMENYNAEKSAFFYYVPALGLMSLGMLVLVLRIVGSLRGKGALRDEGSRHGRRRAPSGGSYLVRVGLAGMLCLLVTYLVWSAVLFGPGATIVIQSSYFMELIGFCLGLMGWWSLSPRLCGVLVALQSALAIWLYGFSPPNLGQGQVPISTRVSAYMLVFALVAIVGCVVSLYWLARQPAVSFEEPEGSDTAEPETGAVGDLVPALR